MAGGLGAYIALMRPKTSFSLARRAARCIFCADGWRHAFPLVAVVLHVLAVVLFTGAGNAMNDIKDARSTKRPTPCDRFPRSTHGGASQSLHVLALDLSVGAHIGGLLAVEPSVSTYLPTVHLHSCRVLMVTYDHGPATKNRGLSGNIVISLLVGAVILYGASAVGGFTQPVIWWIFGVVFLTNLAREMVKDCMDMEADAGSRQTLPMTYGKEKVRMAAYVVIMGALVCLYVPFWKRPFQFGQIALQIPAILTLITLNGPMVQGNDALVAGRIRIAMLLGS